MLLAEKKWLELHWVTEKSYVHMKNQRLSITSLSPDLKVVKAGLGTVEKIIMVQI
jgi:hypothetical protein